MSFIFNIENLFQKEKYQIEIKYDQLNHKKSPQITMWVIENMILYRHLGGQTHNNCDLFNNIEEVKS